jgi:hypothetical protein
MINAFVGFLLTLRKIMAQNLKCAPSYFCKCFCTLYLFTFHFLLTGFEPQGAHLFKDSL